MRQTASPAPPADSALHPRRFAFALVLAAVAGAVDAVGFLHFTTFYVSFMSGNTTRVAVAVAQGDGALALRGVGIICCFVAGVVLGDIVAGVPPRRRRIVLLVEAGLLLVAAALHAHFTANLLLALAMGMHNALALHAERIGLALTYVTGTLVHLGRGIAAWITGHRAKPIWPFAGLWIALGAGAVIGGLLHRVGDVTALIVLAGVLLAIAIVMHSTVPEIDQ